MSRPLVLLSNDDGYRSPGLQTLRTALSEVMDVVVCAPEVEQSGASHALNLHRPLRLFEHGSGVFSVDGTPADCVYIALHAKGRLLPRWPDLVLSGVNRGVNLGHDVFYSGTVAAAREGALKGVPAMALSAALDANLDAAVRLSLRLAQAVLKRPPPHATVLNVNFPRGDNWAIRETCLGRRIYQDEVEFRRDPRGREYLWIGGPGATHEVHSGSDTDAFDDGVVGVTPLILDLHDRVSSEHVHKLVADLSGRSD